MKNKAIHTAIAALASALLLTMLLGGCGRKNSTAETVAPVDTAAPVSTEAPTPTDAPAVTEAPTPTDVPAVTETPTPTEAPAVTEAPTPTAAPVSTEAATPTDASVSTEAPAPTDAPAGTEAPVESPEAETKTERRDGERFEETVILEGMEETVRYEHVRNDTIGVELDYDYELFDRYSEPGCERFVSRWDLPENPQNYLELTCSAQDAETVAASMGAALSYEYDIIKMIFRLERAGSCIRIDASNLRDNGGTPDLLQMVYIVPAADGCRIAEAHYTFESAEGFGRRFGYMMDSLAVIDIRAESPLAGTWQTASIGFADDGTMEPEYHVQFTDAEIVYGHVRDGEFVFDHADPIVSLEETGAGGYRVQAESANGVQYTYQTSESDDGVLEYFETWEEEDFPEMYSGGASLSRSA